MRSSASYAKITVLAGVVAVGADSALAVNTNWDGSDGNSNWHDADNWTSTLPAAGDSAFLGTATLTNVPQVIDLGSTDTNAIFRVVLEGNLGNRSYAINSTGLTPGKLVLNRIDHSANDQGLTINAPIQFTASATIAGDGDQLLRLTNVTGGTVSQGDGGTRVRIGGVNDMTGNWQMSTTGSTGQHLILAHDGALPDGQLRLFGGGAKVSLAASPTVGTNLDVGSTLTLNIAETSGNRTLNVNGAVTGASGQVVIGANESGITGNVTLTVKGTASNTAPISMVAFGSKVQYDLASTTNLNSTAVLSGAGKVVKSNVGTLQVISTNTYTGGTEITGGILRLITSGVSGSLPDTGAVAVSTGASVQFNGIEDTIGSLTGTGTVTLSASANAGTVIASEGISPGNSIGTLKVHSSTADIGTLTLGALGNSTFELGAPGINDLVDMNDTATQLVLDGTLTIEDAGGLAAGPYTLFDMIGINRVTGSFESISMPSGFTGAVSVDGTSGDVILTVAVPEPSTMAAVLGIGGMMVVRRRRR